MPDIQRLSKLLLETAMKVFYVKIVPILTYILTMIWEHLEENSLKMLESVKATYLKKALRVSRFTPLRLVSVLARECLLIEDLRCRPHTDAMNKIVTQRQKKERETLQVVCHRGFDQKKLYKAKL
jgi:hypothetical protein